MGSSKSKPKPQKEPDKFFEREKWREQMREERRKKKAHPGNRRLGTKEAALTPAAPAPTLGPRAPPPPAPTLMRSYDDEALEHMRYQLKNDSEAFLLNSILLSVQFFEHFEREMHNAKSNPLSEREHYIDEAMVRHHKHVFFADRLQECVQEHVCYRRRPELLQPLVAPRLFVIYDNLEASEPGDTSDYSAVLDAPFYKLLIEDCREPGFVKLKKLEVLESNLMKEEEKRDSFVNDDDDSLYSDSEKESNGSDDLPSEGKGDELLQRLKNKINESMNSKQITSLNVKINKNIVNQTGRRRSGPIRQQHSAGNITNIKSFNISTPPLLEEVDSENINTYSEKSSKKDVHESKTRKSILKITRRLSGSTQELKSANSKNHHDNTADSETSGYRSASSSRIESSETESDYGYATITESTTPKKVVLSRQSNCVLSSGVVPDECWTTVHVRCLDNWSDDEDDELDDTASKSSISKNLYETHHYLTSTSFMANFVDNFMIKLGSGLGLTPDSVSNALTQGASVYCDAFRNGAKITYEVFPALIAAWPNAANRWIIRERRVVTNPRTNFSYQWPTKYLVNKAIGFGCLLVPIGFRPKRGSNPDQKMQWRITFPAAERFLESCLAHAQIRCYLFTLTLYKAFMENETCKIGIDASHIKNHLFWQCEDNNAKWPEDRLGESLKTFLESLYINFAQDRFPNYFIDNCNDFKSIPKPLLRDLQRRLADILEAPVMHVLCALEKLKYTKKDFYPTFNCLKLYEILTCRNPLRILNPNLTVATSSRKMSVDSDDEENSRVTDKATDKHYLWSKEKHRQMQEKRNIYNRKQKAEGRTQEGRRQEKREIQINRNFLLPKRMEAERRRLVFEFFIPHFIAMARSSEKFEDIRQALIYLEQAQRLCMLLKEEPAGDITANGYLDIIRDKLADCERKLANQVGYKLTPRRESHFERSTHLKDIRKQRPRFENMLSQDSPTDSPGIPAFTFVEIEPTPRTNPVNLKDFHDREESKL